MNGTELVSSLNSLGDLSASPLAPPPTLRNRKLDGKDAIAEADIGQKATHRIIPSYALTKRKDKGGKLMIW